MITLKEALIHWHDYFLREIVASIIDKERFGKMSQKKINDFFEPDKVIKKKVMAKIEKKLKENRENLGITKRLIKNYESKN